MTVSQSVRTSALPKSTSCNLWGLCRPAVGGGLGAGDVSLFAVRGPAVSGRSGRASGAGVVAHGGACRGGAGRIVLLAADGEQNVDIACRVGVCVDVVSKWRKRFCEEGLAGLKDRPRSGRPRRFGCEVVAGIKAVACEPPEQRNVPLSR